MMRHCQENINFKIVFLVESPFSCRDYDRFGLDILQKNGFEVEVWDFTPFLNPLFCNTKISDLTNWSNYRVFPNWNEARTAILELTDSCFIVCLIHYRYKSYSVYRELSKNMLKYCLFMANALPPIKSEKSLLSWIKKIKNVSLSEIIDLLFVRIPCEYVGILPATLILAGGAKSAIYNYLIGNKTEILWLHTLDYDIYLKECCNQTKKDENICVFLDEFFPYHPDNIYKGSSAYVNPENYYMGLRKFFDMVEHEFGIRVVIAAHPRSNYELFPDYFDGRPIIKGKTAELVKRSQFVICHLSTSINFALLFHKPLIFITSNEIKASYWGKYVESMASQFGKEPINVDNIEVFSWDEEISINENAYMEYSDSYIKKQNSEKSPFWEIFAKHIKKYYASSELFSEHIFSAEDKCKE